MSDDLAKMFAAFEATDFIVHATGRDIVLRHGHTSRELDALLEAREPWAFVTAWNPEGQQAPTSENERAQQQLRERLKSKRILEGLGRAPDRSWEEPSLFVFNCARDEALGLGREFRQVAVLIGTHGERARVTRCSDLT